MIGKRLPILILEEAIVYLGRNMGKYATIKDVAELAGTTAGTVSYVLNNKQGRYISGETRTKVLEAAKQLDYVKSNSASVLKGGNRNLISILVPQFENQFFTRIIVAAERLFMAHGYDLVISNTDDNPEKEKEILERMASQRVEGLIITPTSNGAENTAFLRRNDVPMVIVDRPLIGVENYHWVTTNNYRCGYVGASYLLQKGHKDITYIGWDSGIPDLDSRLEATKKAFGDFGVDGSRLHVEMDAFSAMGGYQATERALEHHPTALFYGFNMQAIGGVNCLRDKKLSVPEDVSVVMIGSPEWAVTGNNQYTHVDMGDMALGRKAAEVLLDQIQGRLPVKNGSHFIQDCTLMEGATVNDLSIT